MTRILLEDVSPHGNLMAVVEATDDVCFFYLHGAENTGFGVRAVWICNLAPAPAHLDHARAEAGEPPMNPRAHCAHPDGAPLPDTAALRVVWLPEGNGAALHERDTVRAIIPPWSGVDGFDGYSRDCIGEGPVAWALTADNALLERFRDAERYWASWNHERTWPDLQDALIARIEHTLGRHSNYYAIDGDEWPPRAVLRIPRADATALVTIGVCARPQPCVELAVEDPAPLRRIELGVLLPTSWPEPSLARFLSYLSAQSRLPWTRYTWLGPGHTIPCDSWHDQHFSSAALTPVHPELGTLSLGPHFGDPVSVLWFLPLTLAEQQRAEHDTTASVLRALPPTRWRDA